MPDNCLTTELLLAAAKQEGLVEASVHTVKNFFVSADSDIYGVLKSPIICQ